MGLKANASPLLALPLRHIGGGVGGLRPAWGNNSRMNQSVGEGIASELAGVPSGTRAPGAWVLPFRAGALASFTDCRATVTPGLLAVAAGRNVDGSATITFSVPAALLQLTVSASGSVSIAFSTDGNLAGGAFVAGAAAVSFATPSVSIGAIVDLVGQAGVVVSPAAVIRALGNLAGDITPFETLSPQSLSAAVLAAMNASPPDVNIARVNGYVVDGAGTAGDPWGPA